MTAHTETLGELWAPGADQPDLRELDHVLVAGAAVRVRVSHPEAVQVSADDAGGTITLVMAAREGRRAITVTVRASDTVTFWRPGSDVNRASLRPSWVPAREHGAFVGPCMGSLVDRGGDSSFGFAAAAGGGRLRARSGMVEETAELLLAVEVDDPSEDLLVVLQVRPRRFDDAVRFLGQAIGLQRAPVDSRNTRPVLCTWYSFHQGLEQATVVHEAELAAELGFGTLIVDDGWQNADTDRGYASCGDWQVDSSKFPDARSFVDLLHEMGMQVIWWIGTPFVGFRSGAYQRQEFSVLYEEGGMGAAVIDPRSVSTRLHLSAKLAALLQATGADGFKLDFLERFAIDGGSPPADADLDDPQRAALRLLDDIQDASPSTVPLMVEFREPYLSPATMSRATMMRVADCPLSPVQNRLGILDMRLATSGIAIHGDPIMWSRDDSPERVAQHLIGGLFGVPQISQRLAGLRDDHERTLRFWIDFWNRYAQLLLGDSLRVWGVESNYPLAEVRDDATVITVRYANRRLEVPAGDWETWILVNGEGPGLVIDGPLNAGTQIEIFDCTGTLLDQTSRGIDPLLIPIPTGGHARLTRSAAIEAPSRRPVAPSRKFRTDPET